MTQIKSCLIYNSVYTPLAWDDTTGKEIKWQMLVTIEDPNYVVSIYDLGPGFGFYNNISNESGTEISIGRYKITSVVSFVDDSSAEVIVEWDNILYKDGGYAPSSYNIGALGTITEYGEILIPAKTASSFTDTEYNDWLNMNNVYLAYSIANKATEEVKTGSIVDPLTINPVPENLNVFRLIKAPIETSLYIEINNISYKGSQYFTYSIDQNSIEWIFTEANGGFDLDPSWSKNAVYDYIVA